MATVTKKSETLANLQSRHAGLKQLRAPWDTLFTELASYLIPEINIGLGGTRPQDARSLLDGTGPDACQMFASGLGAFLIPQDEKWLQLTWADHLDFEDSEGLAWLEEATMVIERLMAAPATRFYTAAHESFFSIGCFGTGVVWREWTGKLPLFRSVPISAVYLEVDHEDTVNSIDRVCKMRGRQIASMFGKDDIPPTLLREIDSDPTVCYDVIHSVFPRTERSFKSVKSTDKAYCSLWWIEGHGILRTSGFDAFPYTVARWFTYPGEIYSVSPGSLCLPEIRCCNKLEELLLEHVAMTVRPPWMTPSSGVLNPTEIKPGSLIYYEFAELGNVGPEALRNLRAEGDYPVGEDKLEQKRAAIRRAFLVELFERETKKERQTALEITDQRQQMLNLVAPHLGRVVTEFVTPSILWLLDRCIEKGLIPPAPAAGEGRSVKVTYTSPAAQAQLAASGNMARRFLVEDLLPLLQLQPDVLSAVDIDKYIQFLATVSNVPRTVMRDAKELAGIRQKNADDAELAGMAETGVQATQAVKNVAQAAQTGLVGGLL